MKLFCALVLFLLGLIAYQTARIPTAKEIGEGILLAEDNRRNAIMAARAEAERKLDDDIKAQRAAKVRGEKNAQKILDQHEFDMLPKWDRHGNTINRVPPAGLAPTAEAKIGPPPVVRRGPVPTPSPAEVAAEIERKFKVK